MATKTFRAENMLAALQLVHAEMGPNAVVVSAREVLDGPAWQVWRKPMVELVAAAEGTVEAPAVAQEASRARSTAAPAAASDAPVSQPSSEDIAALINRVAMMAAQRTEDARQAKPAASASPAAPAPVETPPAVKPRTQEEKKTIPLAQFLERRDSPKPTPVEKAEPAPVEKPRDPEGPEPILPRSIARVSRLEDKPESNVKKPRLPEPLSQVRAHLLSQGVEAGLVEKTIELCQRTLNPGALFDEKKVKNHIKRQLEVGIKANGMLPANGPRTLFLVGPSGSGKTSTAAKLAAHATQTLGQKVMWVCADTIRIGAISEARTFTELLGLPLKLVYTPEDLSATVRESEADLIIVDTPGCNPYAEQKIVELASMVTRVPNRWTMLTTTASMKMSDLQQTWAAYRALDIRGLVVTRLDETNNYGETYNLAWKSQAPLAWFTTGTRVVEDLQPATTSTLVSALMGDSYGF